MLVFLPFLILGLAADIALCAVNAWDGWVLAIIFIVLLIAFSIAFLALYVLFLLLLTSCVNQKKPQEKPSRFFKIVLNYSYAAMMKFVRMRIHVSGLEKIPQGRWLLVSNHRSNFDPLVTGLVLKRYDLGFVSKPQNMKMLIAGGFAHKICCIPLDREDDRAALRTIIRASEYISNDITSMGIYPEGTRNYGEELLPFRNGAFKIAQKAKAPIVILTVKNTEKTAKNFPWHHTDVYISVVDVIDRETVVSKKTAQLGELVREKMERAIAEQKDL